MHGQDARDAIEEAPSDELKKSVGFRGWWTLFVLTVLYAISTLDRQVFNLLLVPIGQSLALNDFELGLLSGFAFAFCYATLGIAFGWLVDRSGRRGIVFGGVVVWSIATAACGLVKNFWQFALARFGVGGGEATLNPAAFSIISDLMPRHRLSFALALFGLGPMIGGIAAQVGAAGLMAVIPEHGMALPFVGVQEPWRVVFILFGAVGLVFALAVLTFREPPRRERLKSKTADSTALKYIWERRKFYLWFLGGAAMIYAMNYGLGAWMPAFFMRTYGLSVTQMGYLAAPMILVPQIVGLLATGAIADKFFSKGRTDIHLILLMVLASLKAIFVAVAMSAGLGLVPTAILVGCATLCSGATGVAPAVLQLVTPNQYRGQTASAYLLATSLVGLGLGPLITGFLTTFVFQDPAKVGWSIAVSFVLLQPLAVLALTRALPEVRKAASEAEGWK